MFIATTSTPKEETDKETATNDFIHLLGRVCEYMEELENLGKVKKGSFMPLYDSVCNDAKNVMNENWIN